VDYQLLMAVLISIALLLLLILQFKIQAFLALLIASMVAGILAGMPPTTIIDSMKKGMGDTLGFVATVVGLGALFGALLERTGGARSLADYMLEKMSLERAPWAMVGTGLIVSIPVFFDVAFIILVPIIYALQRQTGKSLLFFGMPLLAGLAVAHGFIPPTPGPVAVAHILGADLGYVILFGLVIGIPTAVISGPIFGSYVSNKIEVAIPDYMEETTEDKKSHVAPGMIITIIFIPILLMVINTAVKHIPQTAWPIPSAFTVWIGLIGHPFTALIIANLLAWYFLGLRQGMTRDDIQEMWSKSLAPAGLIILLTGAGGMFKQILIDTGAGAMLAQSLAGDTTTPIMFAFVCSVLVRVIQGSATVAMITSAGLTAPLLLSFGGAEVYKALVVIAIASGATMMSHVNDSGFWLVNRYFGLTERQTLQSWTILTVILGLTGFTIALILSMVI